MPALLLLKRLGQRPQRKSHISLVTGLACRPCILSGSIMGSGSVFPAGRHVDGCNLYYAVLAGFILKVILAVVGGLNIGFRGAGLVVSDRICAGAMFRSRCNRRPRGNYP